MDMSLSEMGMIIRNCQLIEQNGNCANCPFYGAISEALQDCPGIENLVIIKLHNESKE